MGQQGAWQGLTAMACRFGLVGGVAAIVHIGVVVSAVEAAGADPRFANLLGFLAAFPLSYLGHYFYSFESHHAHDATMARFLVVSLSCFLAGQAIMTLVHGLGLRYGVGLAAIVVIVPIVSFALNKLLVFQRRQVLSSPAPSRR